MLYPRQPSIEYFTSVFFWRHSNTAHLYCLIAEGECTRNMRGFAFIYFNFPFICPSVHLIDDGLVFNSGIAGSSSVANTAVSSAKVAVLVSSDVWRPLV